MYNQIFNNKEGLLKFDIKQCKFKTIWYGSRAFKTG